ncbi:E3 ubiquitin-protein ligase lubel isoform X2 [Halyomorpha halys]|uniref:E3 ubiquitin-protein ligase lubel isoform X2 n=1 Tax=Halyomorpha halys TaxID=286706 RepID=UPI0006D51623|nr:uncharacterized protein LOC106683669 isoform X2 [Halyomorpha halys]
MQEGDRWHQIQSTKPSARLRAARAMPQWITARGSAIPPPPPPPQDDSPPVEPEYEVIEFAGQQTYSNQPIIRGKELREKKRCDLCGSSAPAVRCQQCVQQNFCYSCDEMYHRHPKRQFHTRKELEGGGLPPLPPKGEPQPPPVPPPRRNKRGTPRPQHSPLPPPIPPSPQISQREQMHPKQGFMGSLKRMIGGRQLPIVPHGIEQQNQLPVNNSMMKFHDSVTNCNGCQDWMEFQRGTRSGSFNSLNPPNFGMMMQSQSMAHLNCPSCQKQPMWNPWNGMPAAGTWQSSAFLNRYPPREEWSDSDSEAGWHRERQRRFSTLSAKTPKSYGFDDTHSVRGGRRTDAETSSNKGNRRKDFETMSNFGGSRRHRSGSMSLRGSRKSDLENSLPRSQKRFNDVLRNKGYDDESDGRIKDSETSDIESDIDFVANKSTRKIMSDVEDMHMARKKSEPMISKSNRFDGSRTVKGQSKRNEEFTDIERKKSSFTNTSSSAKDESRREVKNARQTESEHEDDLINGIETKKEDEEELGPIPDDEWECKHCTFINQGGTRVCTVCCKTTAKPKLSKTTTSPPTEDFMKKLIIEDKLANETLPKNTTKELKEKRGISESNRILTSKGTSPPPQSISTQTYEEAGRKLKRATSLADYGNWKTPQRSTSRQSLLSDTQSLPVTPPRSQSPEQKKYDTIRRSSDQFSQRSIKRAGSQPPEYISSLVQKQVKQGLEMVKLLREAEEHQFSAEDLAIALLHCGDGDPINWLQENWRNMIDTVVTLGTNYGQERKENIVGTISASEAREALRVHNGNVWAAVTECVEQRQRKYAELLSRGNFSREDIVTVLTANHGNLEEAYKELNKNQLKPFLMRIWGPPQGADNDDGDITKLAHGELDGQGDKNSEEVSVDLSIESNFDRIQNWLDHVNINNRARFSQSMLQLNLIGSNTLESESKFRTSTKNFDFSAKRQTSDIHRYLTSFYNANEKSLRIGTKNIYGSEQNLSMTVQHNENINNLHEPEPIQSSSVKSENSNEHQRNEPETVTIKLKPIVVSINDDHSDNSESNEAENLSFNQKNTVELDILSHSTDDLIRDTKEIIFNSTSDIDKASSINKHLKLSRSNSETSNESFESLHSSGSENKNIYQNTTVNILENESTSSIDIYENIGIMHTDKKQKEIGTYQHTSKRNDVINNNNYNQLNTELAVVDPLTKSQSENLQPHNKIDNQLLPSERINKQIEKPVEPIVSEETDNLVVNYSNEKIISPNNEQIWTMKDKINQNFVKIPTSNSSTSSLNEENESNYMSDGSLITNKEQVLLAKYIASTVKETKENSIKDYQNHTTSYTTSENSYPSKANSTSSKSDSDINDGESNEFSEESADYIDQEDPPLQMVKIKREQISEENSEKENNSSIKQDKTEVTIPVENNTKTNTENNLKNNLFHYNQTELIDILKQNLTKDDVVEKIVHTLFASVLRASTETYSEQETELLQKLVNNKKIEPKEIGDESSLAGDHNFLQDTDIAEKELISNLEKGTAVVAPVINDKTSKEIHSSIDNKTEIEKKLKIQDEGIHALAVNLVEEEEALVEIYNNNENKTEIEEKLQIQKEEFTSIVDLVQEEKKLEEIRSNNDNNIIIEEKLQMQNDGYAPVEDSVQKENKLEEICSNNENKPEINEKLQMQIKDAPVAGLVREEKKIEVICSINDNNKTEIVEKLQIGIEGINDPAVALTEEEKTQEETNSNYDNSKKIENIFINESKFQKQEDSKIILTQREARRLLAEGLVATYEQAEIALQLKELNLDEDDGAILAAANDCDSLESAIAFLQQECQLCAGKYSVKQMISMLECEHRCCHECANNYFTLQITEKNINDCTCPFCKEPDILQLEEDKVLTYFSHLDILLKGLVKENVHELFQRKLRDRTLMQDPNFKWCIKCSSGYIANPRQKRLMCPDCKAVTCAKCMKPWEKEHETMSCDEYQAWLKQNDPENQLAQHLDENGVTCPNCKSKYLLAKGGCMHLICPHCKHEFCSGCSKPFLMGKKCSLSEYCEKLGLHSHHPRNCLFYLRDKEPEQLEKLLEDNNINFKNEETVDNKRCHIQLLKETPEGLVEAICGYTTVKAGLCRKHYVELLSRLIRQNMIETIDLLDEDDLETVIRRTGRKPPLNSYGTPKSVYRSRLLQVIAEEIPLD